MGQKSYQSGFGMMGIVLIIVVVAIVAVGGILVYQHHKKPLSSGTTAGTTSQSATQSQTGATTQNQLSQYLDIKEWGVKLPLSSQITDAYYVIPPGISNDTDGKPSGVYLSTKSLNGSCGDASTGNTDRSIENAVGSIVRALPTDTDPVSGKSYTQLEPNGVTIGGYYYGYGSHISGKTCASKSLLQSIDSAFATAVKNAVADTAQ